MRSFIIPKTEVSGGSCGVSTGAINNNDENDEDDAGHTWVSNDASVQSKIMSYYLFRHKRIFPKLFENNSITNR